MPPHTRRGRPPETDPGQIAEVALRLMERKGFDRVTMDEIAAAASVSRRTLFRLYPSKAELVWAGVTEVLDALKARAADLPRAGSLDSVVSELILPVVHLLDEPEAARLARRRLRLIAAAPALLNHPTLREIEQLLERVVPPSARSAAPPSLVARTLVATLFAAFLWWAEAGKALSPVEVVQAALKAMALASAGHAR